VAGLSDALPEVPGTMFINDPGFNDAGGIGMRRPASIFCCFICFILSLFLGCCDLFRADLEFEPAELPDAQVGAYFDVTITISGNKTPVYQMSISSGRLPDGLTLDYHETNNYAKIIGTPSVAGIFTFQVWAQCFGSLAQGQSGTKKYVIEVNRSQAIRR
jgi:hypothetical protein